MQLFGHVESFNRIRIEYVKYEKKNNRKIRFPGERSAATGNLRPRRSLALKRFGEKGMKMRMTSVGIKVSLNRSRLQTESLSNREKLRLRSRFEGQHVSIVQTRLRQMLYTLIALRRAALEAQVIALYEVGFPCLDTWVISIDTICTDTDSTVNTIA